MFSGRKFYLWMTSDPVDGPFTLSLPCRLPTDPDRRRRLHLARVPGGDRTVTGRGNHTLQQHSDYPRPNQPPWRVMSVLAIAPKYNRIDTPIGMQEVSSVHHVGGIHIMSAPAASLAVEFDTDATVNNKAGWAVVLRPEAAPGAAAAPANLVAPVVTGNTAPTGTLVMQSPGDWSGQPAPVLTFDWRKNGSSTGITTATFDKGGAVANGDTVLLRVTATNASGSAFQDSNVTTIVSAPAEPEPTADVPEEYAYMGKWALVPNIVAADYPRLVGQATKFATPANFATVANGLVPGDVLILENGTYGEYEFLNRAFASRVTITARNYGMAVFPRIGVIASHFIRLHGLKLTGRLHMHRSNSLQLHVGPCHRHEHYEE